MTWEPYTLVTLCLEENKSPRLNVSFNTSRIEIHTFLVRTRPVLNLHSGEAAVSITSTGGGAVTTEDVETARRLFNAAARYLAECERSLDAQAAQPDGTA